MYFLYLREKNNSNIINISGSADLTFFFYFEKSKRKKNFRNKIGIGINLFAGFIIIILFKHFMNEMVRESEKSVYYSL